MKKFSPIGFLILSVFLFTSCTKALDNSNKQSSLINKGVNLQANNTTTESLKNQDTTQYINISNVDFLSSKIGYMSLSCSKNTNGSSDITYKLLRTQDGGYHWVGVGNNDLIELTSFIDDKVGFGKEYIDKNTNNSSKNILVKTVDGGLNWNPIDFVKGTNMHQVDILNKNTMFIRADSNKNQSEPFMSSQIYRSVNEGKTWSLINLPINTDFPELVGMS